MSMHHMSPSSSRQMPMRYRREINPRSVVCGLKLAEVESGVTRSAGVTFWVLNGLRTDSVLSI